MKPPIFVLGSGRTGSTLVQRILNSYSDITIWGEHGGFLKETAEAFFRILENRGNNEFIFSNSSAAGSNVWEQIVERKSKLDQWQAWLNCFSRQDVVPFFRNHMESFFRHASMGENHFWGFKEIRYGNKDRVVEFLSLLYPDACFVFLTRNGFNTIASQEKAFARRTRLGSIFPSRSFRHECRAWSVQNRTLWDWHASGRIRSFWLSYEDFSSSLEALAPLLASLDKKIGPLQEKVLQMEGGRGSAFSSRDTNRWKNLGYLQLCWAEMIMGNVNETLRYVSPRRIAWLGHLRRSLGRFLGMKSRINTLSRSAPTVQSPELAVARGD